MCNLSTIASTTPQTLTICLPYCIYSCICPSHPLFDLFLGISPIILLFYLRASSFFALKTVRFVSKFAPLGAIHPSCNIIWACKPSFAMIKTAEPRQTFYILFYLRGRDYIKQYALEKQASFPVVWAVLLY